MTDPVIPDPLDGFHVEIDTGRERADLILDRPPLNVITMPQRERAAFEAFDADDTFVSSCCGHWVSIFPAAARSVVSSKPPPSMCHASPGTSPRRRAAASR
jgi:hypothetical protein